MKKCIRCGKIAYTYIVTTEGKVCSNCFKDNNTPTLIEIPKELSFRASPSLMGLYRIINIPKTLRAKIDTDWEYDIFMKKVDVEVKK